MQRWIKRSSAIGCVLALAAGSAFAAPIEAWEYTVTTVFVTTQGATQYNGAGVGSQNGCESATFTAINWGSCAASGSASGSGRSGLRITNTPQFGSLVTNGPGQPANTYIHDNNVVNLSFATLKSATVSVDIGLRPQGSDEPFTNTQLNYAIKFVETPNTAGTCVADSPADRPCSDIWVIEGALNHTFTYDGTEYYFSFYAAPTLTRLPDEVCDAVPDTQPGCVGFTTIEDMANEVNFLLEVAGPLEAEPPPTGVAGSPYDPITLVATGGAGPYTWSGTLPPGMTLDPDTGELSGTPALGSHGSYTITVTDSFSPANAVTLTLEILPPPVAIETTSLPSATQGTAYNLPLAASGGTAPFTWSATGLPPGLSLVDGVITGTPTETGTYPVTVVVTDDAGQTTSMVLELNVTAAATVHVQPVPTLGEWGLGLLSIFAAALGAHRLRRAGRACR